MDARMACTISKNINCQIKLAPTWTDQRNTHTHSYTGNTQRKPWLIRCYKLFSGFMILIHMWVFVLKSLFLSLSTSPFHSSILSFSWLMNNLMFALLAQLYSHLSWACTTPGQVAQFFPWVLANLSLLGSMHWNFALVSIASPWGRKDWRTLFKAQPSLGHSTGRGVLTWFATLIYSWICSSVSAHVEQACRHNAHACTVFWKIFAPSRNYLACLSHKNVTYPDYYNLQT